MCLVDSLDVDASGWGIAPLASPRVMIADNGVIDCVWVD